MTSDKWNFSIPGHTCFLDGYLDAVSRVLTSESEQILLSAQLIEGEPEAEAILGMPLGSGHSIDDWSEEFGSLVENVLRADQRSRLGFYLIEYICWFKEFLSESRCYRFACTTFGPSMLGHAVYILVLENNQRVLIVASRSSKCSSDG